AVALEHAAQPGSERDCARQRYSPANGMNHRGAGEVMKGYRGHIRQPAVRSPCPVADDRIDEAGDAYAVEQVADEVAAPNHRARGYRRAGIRECILEYPVGEQGNARGAIGGRQPVQHETGSADPRGARAEHEREAPQPEGNAAYTCIGDSLHKYIHRLA